MDRSRHPVGLTPAGEALLAEGELILLRYETALEAVRRASGEVAGTLRLTASTIPAEYLRPPLLVGFVRLHQAVLPELSVSDSGGVYDRLVEGSAAFGFTGARRDDLGLTHEPFAEDDIVLAVLPGQAPASVDLSGLAALPLLVREEGSGTLLTVRVKLRAAGLNLAEVRPVMRLGSTQAVLTAVRAGGGVGFVSRRAAASSLADGSLQEVRVDGLELRRTLWLVYDPGRAVGGLRHAFLEYLRAHAAAGAESALH
jgi:DNA-binding transcriptional LysR family regulator